MKKIITSLLLILTFTALHAQPQTAHVIVALCDNFYQGIVPVPLKLGNGSDPDNNLYWGALYGAKTHLRKSKEWLMVSDTKNVSADILRRTIFKHKDSEHFVILDAYKGKKIKLSLEDFFDYASGARPMETEATFKDKKYELTAGGGAGLLMFVGHNGLMDFELKKYPKKETPSNVKAGVLACYSKSYFEDKLKAAGATPVLLTNGKMAPEGYVLQAALDSWVSGASKADYAKNAGAAYSKYQKISEKAGYNLFK
ncbi:hypothetical protein Dip510_001158 [Elusimicrobium posterum]|uniref:hypothetical protein n=1 Tax=Elusimicrobium posterum TaxID=3116653 RepID=UPI003C767042